MRYTKERISQEFNYLKENIDNNKEYESRLVENSNLNRYRDIRPYKDNLVQINSGNKYINASWINMPENHFFITTQGPLDTTIDDFWEMFCATNANVIVMLCGLVENNKIKCANYWDSNKINNFDFEQINNEFDIYNGIRLRNFKIKKKGLNNLCTKTAIQLHYTCWADHTAPDEQSYHKLIKLIENMNWYKGDKTVIVHCSAGVGRTGTFIALYNLYCQIKSQIDDNTKSEITFSIMDIVRQLKEMRAHLVENFDQYLFLYQFVDLLLKQYN